MDGAELWASVGRVWSEPSPARADVRMVDAQRLGGLPPQVALVSQLGTGHRRWIRKNTTLPPASGLPLFNCNPDAGGNVVRSEEHTSELQSRGHLVCRLLLEKKKRKKTVT